MLYHLGYVTRASKVSWVPNWILLLRLLAICLFIVSSVEGLQLRIYPNQQDIKQSPTIPPKVRCFLNQTTCANGQCIPRNQVCDGSYDCTDHSDEYGCRQCEPNEFKCKNKKCVHRSWVCDGQDDCRDGSDEKVCTPQRPGEKCGSQQFTCRSGKCIPRSFHCDGQPDCMDRSDEIGCTAPVIAEPPPSMITLKVGQTFTITCRADGVPTPEIIWRLNWHHVPPKCRMTSENGFGTLICENIQIEDQGAYSCEAISSLKTVFATPDTILTVVQDSVCRSGTSCEFKRHRQQYLE